MVTLEEDRASLSTAALVLVSMVFMIVRGSFSVSGAINHENSKGMPRLSSSISISTKTPPSRCSRRVIVNVRQTKPGPLLSWRRRSSERP